MKTTMQEMLEWIEQRFNNPQETEVFKKATELLEKEKEQIIDAYDEGIINGESNEDGNGKMFYNLYYNQTYNQNK
jgi:hypothetical protein